MLSERLKMIRERIAAAARRSGRSPDEITLVAVSKGQPAEKIREAIEAGQRDFGENYAQELSEHMNHVGARFPRPGGETPPLQVNWHFIGHLQRNKVKTVLPQVSLIHSVDSLPLAQEIDKRAATLERMTPILLEVNLGNEDSKTGLSPHAVEPLVREISNLAHIDLRGLMVVPPFMDDPEKTRPLFRRLREIRDAINAQNVYKRRLSGLSMGMTHDFECAVEEGATIVRVGRGLFGEREK